MRIKSMMAALVLAASMQAQQAAPAPPTPQAPRIDLTFTAEQQDLAQQLRAMQAEFELDQAKKDKIDVDLKRLLSERDTWMAKVEAAHSGYRLSNDERGFFLVPAAPVASVPGSQK